MALRYDREVQEIRFGVLSAEEILAMSVVEVNSPRLDEGENGELNYTDDGKPMAGVYDERMGCRMDRTNPCVTCSLTPEECPGHFGHIALNVPIVHPLFYKDVLSFLRCFCASKECGKMLIDADQIELYGLLKRKGRRRFAAILDKLEKVDICSHCSAPQPQIAFVQSDCTYTKTYEQKKKKVGVTMEVEEIKETFTFISPEDVTLLGFDPKLTHPKNMIIEFFPVIPPCARPFVIADGNMCDDDLTVQIIEIIKANNALHPYVESDEVKRGKAYQTLKFRIATYYDNSGGKAKHTTNNRAIKGIKERLTGKEGQLRNNNMGKRVEFSARTVITADPTLDTDQLGCPDFICQILTFPESATERNLERLRGLVERGEANYVRRVTPDGTKQKFPLKYAMYRPGTQLLYGDVVLRQTGKDRIKELFYENGNITLQPGDRIVREGVELTGDEVKYPERKPFQVEVGDVVDRHLIDGDVVILNRQPTLHKGSMMAFKIKRHSFKTLRLNLAVTKSFNADEHQRLQQGA